MDLDLRRELAEVLDAFGYNVLVLHNDRRIKCPVCWSSSYREPLSDCPVCLGTGYAYKVSRHRTRSAPLLISPSSVSASMTGLIYQQASGPANARFEIEAFYFPHDVEIGVNDYILRVRWNGGTPVDVADVYLVTRYDRVRGRGGRVEYIYAMGMLKPEELGRFQNMLNRLKEAVRGTYV